MQVKENPCQGCPDNCCTISGWCGLMLSRQEFETHFRAHKQDLLVREENGIVIISTGEGCMCPHFQSGGCGIYQDRPVDCRLHPYQMRLSYETGNRLKFILHTRSQCPRKEDLLVPETAARALVAGFGKQLCGDKEIIIKRCDSLLSRIINKSEAVLVKLCQASSALPHP